MGRAVHASLNSHGDGESEARLRLAFRISDEASIDPLRHLLQSTEGDVFFRHRPRQRGAAVTAAGLLVIYKVSFRLLMSVPRFLRVPHLVLVFCDRTKCGPLTKEPLNDTLH